MKNFSNNKPSEVDLKNILDQRILIMDGAMGTMIQQEKLEENDFRGDLFKKHKGELKGNNDLLSLTRPDVIEKIHSSYFEAGSDLVETNTFSATSIAMADYNLEDIVYDLNVASARLARKAADKAICLWLGILRVVGSEEPTSPLKVLGLKEVKGHVPVPLSTF